MTFVGFTALSVETWTTARAPKASAASATLREPSTLVATPSVGLRLYGAYRVKSGAWCRVSSSISWPEARSFLRDGPRGARHQARTSRHRLVFGGPGGI